MPAVQLRSDKLAVRIDVPPTGELDPPAAIQLARDLIDAVTQCGFEVKMNVEVPRHQPTDQQLALAVTRVGHIRRNAQQARWDDGKVNSEIVMRVIEACL
jgi:hypothetical protein